MLQTCSFFSNAMLGNGTDYLLFHLSPGRATTTFHWTTVDIVREILRGVQDCTAKGPYERIIQLNFYLSISHTYLHTAKQHSFALWPKINWNKERFKQRQSISHNGDYHIKRKAISLLIISDILDRELKRSSRMRQGKTGSLSVRFHSFLCICDW